jgi:hypothetical protein
MPLTTAVGPAAGASWRPVAVSPEEREARMLVLPDAAHPRVYYAIPAAPPVARDAAGRPVFSLTLVLTRSPTVHEQSVHPLIQQGILTFDITLAPPDGVLDALADAPELVGGADGPAEVRPLFAREAAFALGSLATAPSGAGIAARATLQATLDRVQALGVLAALDGGASGLTLTSTVRYRAAGTVRRRLSAEWSAVYDFMLPRLASGDRITRDELRRWYEEMARAGLVRVTPAASPDEAAPLFDAFVRQSIAILRRLTPDLPSTDAGNLYALRARPADGTRLEHQEESSADSIGAVTVEAPLEAVLHRLLDGEDRDRYVRLVSLTGGDGGGGLGPPPRPQRLAPNGGSGGGGGRRREGMGAAVIALAASDGELKSVARKLRPELHRNAQTMILSGVARPIVSDKLDWYLDDWRVELQHDKKRRSLPIVTNPAEPLWPDRVDANKLWYAPVFELLQPAPNADPASSPFQFSFRRIGETPSGPALEGTIRFSLRRGMSDQTRQALAARGQPSASPVPTGNLAVSLVLPFINANDNQLAHHTCPCTITDDGQTVTATVTLATDWVRIAYTLLSNPSAQAEPARIAAAFSYEAYTVVRRADLHVAFGSKQATIPVIYSAEQAREVAAGPYLDATAATLNLNFDGGAVLLAREAPMAPRRAPRDEPAWRGPGMGMTAGAVATAVMVAPLPTVTSAVRPAVTPILGSVAQPVLRPGIDLAAIVGETAYAVRTLLRQEQIPAAFPCNVLGAFYRETTDGDAAVGCRPAMELGRVSYRRYERVPELDSVAGGETQYQVYRSLQQPGRFLVLPARYAITRYPPGGPDAYRARVLLYSDEDPAHALRTPIVFTADLQPELLPHARRELELKLAALAATPAIEYPTAVECDTAYTFHALDSTPVAVTRTPDSFTVSIAATAADWPLLFTRLQTGGVLGEVRFMLGDGTELQSMLTVDLRHITGPWADGAVTSEPADGGVRLTNRIDRPVDVHELLLVRDGSPRRAAVERSIAAGAVETVALAADGAEIYPVYTAPASPEALQAVPNAIERIHVNVLFTNQIRFANHELSALAIAVRRAGSAEDEQVVVVAETTVAQVDLLLPLTEYVAQPLIQLRIVRTFADGRVETKEWFDWNLNTMGFVVGLTWSFIQ